MSTVAVEIEHKKKYDEGDTADGCGDVAIGSDDDRLEVVDQAW